ncbi:T9SS type B sorting domain-containing protein [Pseudoflavitalea sp. X16]|uniref:LamG-like jellyroll fold domain-containing protein n=1 Tax=Paraflavitalea devenefica TaxID=2716334 RepID=UPI001423AD32|nr:LamG-like jellyroll fold domain-containing protein [Paraflavitalea devenefica]NII27978.1 T9SS type B sorting domain-containing protein [Paraflavitalea devenefica]
MRKTIAACNRYRLLCICSIMLLMQYPAFSQTPAFPGADGFGRFAKGARGAASQEVYIVTNLNDNGTGSFRDAVSKSGRIVVFAVGGIVRLQSDVSVAANVTIAGQTAPGDGIVFFNKRITFTGATNTICRFLRVRLGATNNSGNDASGLANGKNMIFDHMSFTWGMDEVFSINWDGKNTAPDSITVQNSIIGQGLHRENHSAGGLIQTPDGGKVSLIRNLYISNKTRNPKVKGVNEFVNNVVYDWGNGNRLDTNMNYGWSGDAYIMGGSSGVSEVNIINNYFVGGPLTPPNKTTPFSRGTGTFNLYGAGNYFDNDKNGILDGTLVPYDNNGYPGIEASGFKATPYNYPAPVMFTAEQAYQWICDSVGACYPRRDQVDDLMVNEVRSKGTQGLYVYRETNLPLPNGGLGDVFSANPPLDSDGDGMPDAWEDANGLNKNNKSDAVAYSTAYPQYLNIEVYINSLIVTPAPVFVKPPSGVTLSATSSELPVPSSTIIVQWTDNASNEDYFVIERTTDGINYTDITHPVAGSVTYTDNNGLAPNTTYYYRIKAVATAGTSAYSTPVSVKTPPVPTAPSLASGPVPVNGFQFAELVSGKVTLKWSGSSNTEKYTVYFGTDPANLVKKAEIVYTTSPSYEVTGLNELVTYYWRIDASNAKGNAEGEVWSFRTTKVIPAGLVGYWSFDETGEGTQVTDSSSYQNHGVLGLDDDNVSIRVPGKRNNALDFATASPDKYVVSIPNQDQLYLNKGPFSLSFWMKASPSLLPPDNNSSAYLLCKGSITKNTTTGATGKRFDIEFKNKQFRFALDDDNDAGGGGKDELQTDGVPFFTGDWVHVVTIRDTLNKKLQVYLNGALVKESAISKSLSGIGEASALVIGNIGELEFLASTNKPAPYKGMLDELKIYNYVLSYPEIVTLYYGSAVAQKPYSPSANDKTIDGISDTLKLTWKGGVNTSKYRFYFGTDAASLTKLSDSVSLATAAWTIKNLKTQTTYYWRVDAIGLLGTTTGDVWSFKTGYAKGLVAQYAFDATAGTTAFDSSGFANHGELVNMTNATWAASGKWQGALDFGTAAGGTRSAITVPAQPQIKFDESSFTISLWVNMAAYSSSNKYNAYLVHKGNFSNTNPPAGARAEGKWYGLQLNDTKLTFAIDTGGSASGAKTNIDITVNSGAYALFNKGWIHVTGVRDAESKQIKVYINGILASTKTEPGGAVGKDNDVLYIGGDAGSNTAAASYHDKIDDLRMYNYALSDSLVRKLYYGTPFLQKVTSPVPANQLPGAGPEKVVLGWADNSGTALTYDVYVGKHPDSLVLKRAGLTQPQASLDTLIPSATYYWRVDAANATQRITGDVWSFITGKDVTPPKVITKSISIDLSTSGVATITAASINDGSNDEYGIDSLKLNRTSFGCANIGANTVTLTVKDKHGNQASATAEVTVNGVKPAQPVITSAADTTICYGDKITLQAGAVNQAASYQWFYQGGAAANAKQVSYTVSSAGVYRLIAISAQTCPSDTSMPVTVRYDADTTINLSGDVTINRGASAELTASGAGSFTWLPVINISAAAGNKVMVQPVTTTRYTATLTNNRGCKSAKSVLVTVTDQLTVEYNHVLTPNGDGVNDKLVFKNLSGYPNNQLQVFDPAGKLVYRKNGYNNEWDGRMNGTPLANGTYFFVLKVNNELQVKGSVTIVH